MHPDQWQQIDQLFHAALALAPHERAAWLVTVSKGDAELQREVATLLAAHEQPGEVWAISASDLAAEWLHEQPLAPSLSGRQISHYQIESLLGQGGMGEVWRAHDTHLNRDVAFKVLPAEFAQDADRLHRFEREAQAISALNHPNIITIHEIGQQDEQHFIITEFIDGESLRQHLHNTRLSSREAIDIAIQIASALAAAHQAGVIHRDIKPENVMIRSDELVKVLDFGLAKRTGLRIAESGSRNEEADTLLQAKSYNPQSTAPGTILGTTSYMSPEQARGLGVDARSDIWSLSCVLYEMVTGRMAFAGETTSDIIAAILQNEPPPIGASASGLSAELNRIVRKALSKDREQRYQTVQDMASDLKRLIRQLEVEATEQSEGRSEPRFAVTVENHRETATVSAVARQTADQIVPRTLSSIKAVSVAAVSVEAVVNEIKRHKPGLTIALLALIAVVAAAYFYLAPSHQGQINSIAVLPFANTSGDPNMEYLSDGLSESLINALAQLPGVKVIARGSAFKYKGKEIDSEEVARALGVQAIVTGRVSQHGDNLQVSAELTDVRDKTQMWGEQFNRKAAELLPVQSEIARQIVEKLRLHLTSKEQQRLVTQANPQAYELLLKGRFYRAKRTAENLQKAVEYYNQAIAIDPNYALAHAVLAEAYRYQGANSYLNPKEMMPKAEVEAQRALALDERLPQIHSTLASIKKDAWDWAGAEREYQRAIELNPNLAAERSGYAYFLSTQKRHEQALTEINKARELDPLAVSYRANIGHILYFAHQYDQSIEQLKQTIELDRNYEYSHVVLGYVYAASGRYAEALAEYQETSRLGGETTSLQCYIGYALAKSGQQPAAEAILKRLETSKEYVSPAELAILYDGLGHTEKALSALEQAYTAHDVQMQFLTADPHYDGLHAEPRFVNLLQKVGLPQ